MSRAGKGEACPLAQEVSWLGFWQGQGPTKTTLIPLGYGMARVHGNVCVNRSPSVSLICPLSRLPGWSP